MEIFMENKELKILTVGNSFGIDTSEYVSDIALSLGLKRVKICVLYIGGCSLNRHYENAQNDLPAYRYYENTGEGWNYVDGMRISEAVKAEKWDYISIQHGTGDGSRYTLPESYANLESLITYIKAIAPQKTKIAFNMAWVMESYSTHPEICSYGGNQMMMYSKLAELTSTVVRDAKGLDIISPAGTAIQNARQTVLFDRLSRDGFHLSFEIGRYIAGLTFFKALTGIEIDDVSWMPNGVTEKERKIAIRCANQAIVSPFEVSSME